MARRLPLLMAVVIATGAIAIPSSVPSSVAAFAPAEEIVAGSPMTPRPVVGVAAAGDIVAGSVGRSSLFLDATYDATLRIAWVARTISVDSIATIRNTSGGPIDRIELNTIAARLGAIRLQPVLVDGVVVRATVSDQTIIVPLGGVLPPGGTTTVRIRYRATVRSNLAGSNWMFTRTNGVLDLYRWLPWVSRRIAFSRPNHGDPFETPSSRSVRVRIV
ncbi:MAG: hypothetical protein QOI37_164, partial [Chloroflexota bacterium]|nr:hypothetical protein [Chloroflexota bacterium]